MKRLGMSVVLPLAVVASVVVAISAVGLLFLSLGNGALVAALSLVILVMLIASAVNARKPASEEGEHGRR